MIKTSKQAISDYWNQKYPQLNLGPNHCWRCGIRKRLDRCHIQARAIEGNDEPSNFVLLCKHCHIDSPNVEDKEFIWIWLNYFNGRRFEDLWFDRGVNEFEMIFGMDLSQMIKGKEDVFKSRFDTSLSMATRHFGQPSYSPSTVAGIIREVLIQMNIMER